MTVRWLAIFTSKWCINQTLTSFATVESLVPMALYFSSGLSSGYADDDDFVADDNSAGATAFQSTLGLLAAGLLVLAALTAAVTLATKTRSQKPPSFLRLPDGSSDFRVPHGNIDALVPLPTVQNEPNNE